METVEVKVYGSTRTSGNDTSEFWELFCSFDENIMEKSGKLVIKEGQWVVIGGRADPPGCRVCDSPLPPFPSV